MEPMQEPGELVLGLTLTFDVIKLCCASILFRNLDHGDPCLDQPRPTIQDPEGGSKSM